jgi:hypothetical protein
MNNSQNSVSQRSSISVNSSNRGKLQNQTKLQDPVTVITNATTQSMCTTLTLMGVGHQKTGRRTSEGLHRKETQGLSIKDPPPQYNQRGGASNHGRRRGRGPYTMKPSYCMYHGNETNHRTKDCPIYLEMKKKMEQGSAQPSHQLALQEVNHTMLWAPHHQQYSPSYPPHFPAQTYQNSQIQPYYQSHHYATTNHPRPSPYP